MNARTKYQREWMKRFRATPEGKAYMAEMHVRWTARLRAEVLAAYGGACACCGETTPEFLTVDHVNNDGEAHRRSLGLSWRKKSVDGQAQNVKSFYSWLRKNGFPKERFRLLCYNCNCGRNRSPDKICPHARKLRVAS